MELAVAVVAVLSLLAMVWSHHRTNRQLLESQEGFTRAVLALQNPMAAQVYANLQAQAAAQQQAAGRPMHEPTVAEDQPI